METLREISQWIREYVNDPPHQQRLLSLSFSWNQLCTAMDVIDDIDLAVEAYLSAVFPDDDGEKYLRIYGLLQSLFVQQDALRHLIKIVKPSIKIDLSEVLKEVRDLRSASIGHPTEFRRNGEKSVHAISRITLCKDGFQMMSFDESNGTSFRNVPVRDLIETQRKEAARILLEVVNQLREEDRTHKKRFREVKLENSFNQVLYAFEKISEDLRQYGQPAMGKWGAEHLQSSVNQFESLLKQRGMDINTYDSIKYRYDEIKYPLDELRKFFAHETSDIPKREAAQVFADALQTHFSELMDIAREIDEEYSLARNESEATECGNL
jgi:hypothetical protein